MQYKVYCEMFKHKQQMFNLMASSILLIIFSAESCF